MQLVFWAFTVSSWRGKRKNETRGCNYSCFQLPVMQQAGTWMCFRPFLFGVKATATFILKQQEVAKRRNRLGNSLVASFERQIAFKGSDFFHQCPAALTFGFLFASSYNHPYICQLYRRWLQRVVAHQEPHVRTRPCPIWASLLCVPEVGWYLACWLDLPSWSSALAVVFKAWGLKPKSNNFPNS